MQGKADVVFGSRYSATHGEVPLYWHTLGNRALTTFSNFFTDRSFTDVHTCYKVFRADVIKAVNLEEDRFAFDPEITLKLARSKTRIFEVPISYNGRSYAEGKKIGLRGSGPGDVRQREVWAAPRPIAPAVCRPKSFRRRRSPCRRS